MSFLRVVSFSVLFLSSFAQFSPIKAEPEEASGFLSQLATASAQKIEVSLRPPAYPDLAELRERLLGDMPALTGNETRRSDFKEFRSALGRHGGEIDAFKDELVRVCDDFDQLDVRLRALNQSRPKIILDGDYNEAAIYINEAKEFCLTNPKRGPYWRLYDNALDLLEQRESAIEEAAATCRRTHPSTCV